MKSLFDNISHRSSAMVTKSYSTSFSLGILLLDKPLRQPIYGIYGFVRFADEIVDTFHGYPQEKLLEDFKRQTYEAIENRISLNPILNAFQETVHQYNIDRELIDTFLHSMAMDLNPIKDLSTAEYEEYILGSAEVVGLMCLKVFCNGDEELYNKLKYNARKLGSAFQKINFLRDLQADYHELGRIYFPGINMAHFNDEVKKEIEADIEKDFHTGYEGLKQLPRSSRFGVYIAYVYFFSLLQKIKATPSNVILQQRVRIANHNKYGLLLSSYLKHSFNLI